MPIEKIKGIVTDVDIKPWSPNELLMVLKFDEKYKASIKQLCEQLIIHPNQTRQFIIEISEKNFQSESASDKV